MSIVIKGRGGDARAVRDDPSLYAARRPMDEARAAGVMLARR
jgi:hypothetical protein